MRFEGRCRTFKPMESRSWFIGIAAVVSWVGSILACYGHEHEGTVRNVSKTTLET